jgi:hypothetical protein
MVSELYSVDPEEFVAARNALVKTLKAEGDKAEAARVAKLRRPSVPAWALNQVARADPALVEKLLEEGARLRQAMTEAVSGDASKLRDSDAVERAAADEILVRATDVIAASGKSAEVHRQRMSTTLRAAVLDESVAAALRSGCLDSDYDAPAFGFDSLPVTDIPPRPDARVEREREAKIARLQEEADRLTRKAERLDSDASNAERRARELRAEATRAAEEAAEARTTVAD